MGVAGISVPYTGFFAPYMVSKYLQCISQRCNPIFVAGIFLPFIKEWPYIAESRPNGRDSVDFAYLTAWLLGRSLLRLLAVGAQTENLKGVGFDGKTVAVSDLTQPGFAGRVDFHGFAATLAHQMVVMSVVAA